MRLTAEHMLELGRRRLSTRTVRSRGWLIIGDAFREKAHSVQRMGTLRNGRELVVVRAPAAALPGDSVEQLESLLWRDLASDEQHIAGVHVTTSQEQLTLARVWIEDVLVDPERDSVALVFEVGSVQ